LTRSFFKTPKRKRNITMTTVSEKGVHIIALLLLSTLFENEIHSFIYPIPLLCHRCSFHNHHNTQHDKHDKQYSIIGMSITDDLDSSFVPKFDNQLIYGLEVDDKGQVETSLKNIQTKSGVDVSNLDEDSMKSKSNSISPSEEYIRERSKINKVPVISRKVHLGVYISSSTEELASTIWEMEKPSDLVENWMTASPSQKENVIRDPFGVVMWPGSILASQEMHALGVAGKTVLILGAGTGVEAQAAAMLGAKKVIATDVNRFTLRLLKFGAKNMGLDHIIEGREFDIFSLDPLPPSDVVIAADILYNEQLAIQVARRFSEIYQLPEEERPNLIITDSQKFHGTDFLNSLKEDYPNLEWEDRILYNVTGSGILIEEDQTYDIKARILVS